MTPQEKADDLVKKMYKVHSDSASLITLHFAKQCAIIAVEEILKDYEEFPYKVQAGKEYWMDVWFEIEKL